MGHWKRELAHTLIDAGAHIYVAHGDPRLQGTVQGQGNAVPHSAGVAESHSSYGQGQQQPRHCSLIDTSHSFCVRLCRN
jgi:hypothetical protein